MANPKYRMSKSKTNKRRSHLALTPELGSVCPNCKEIKHAHHVCPSCGFFRGKQVMQARNSSAALTDTFDTE